jgi:hypothetical protein
MHFGFLSGLLLVLAAALPNPASAPAPLYSVLAQAETPTAAAVPTDTTPTVLATPELTATAEVTATATVTGTPFVPTPIEPAAPQGNLQLNPFDWGFLTSPPTEPKIGPFGWFYIVFMLALTGAGIYFYFIKRPQWKRVNAVWHKAANRFAQPAIWIGVIGLLFALFRVVSLDFFNLRIWFYIMMLAALALFGWISYWYRTSYPKEMARFQKTMKARQYMPGKARSTPAPARPAATTPSATSATTTTTTTAATAPSGVVSQASRHAPRRKNRKRR